MKPILSCCCALLGAAQIFVQAGGADCIVARVQAVAERGTLTAYALAMELGEPRIALMILTGDFPKPHGTPSDTPVPSAVSTETPSPTDTPSPAPMPTPTEPPALTPAPTESPAPTDEPEDTPAPTPGEPAAEVISFTDSTEVVLKNNTSFEFDITSMLSEPLTQRVHTDSPAVLVIHTHGTEAYYPTAEEPYEASDAYRTLEAERSVVGIGDIFASELENAGISVIHDRGFYDYPSYTGSYARSSAAIEYYLNKHPGIALVIDLHRDALGGEGTVYRTNASSVETPCAQVMLVVGTGENGLEHPFWRENLKLALALRAAADASAPSLMRPIMLCRERYNQQLTTGSLIVEVGTNGNTFSEAAEATRLFARSIAPVILSLPIAE